MHLAGAVGKPVWTLLPIDADGRCLIERRDSPRYPTMQLFRQPRDGDWASVFGEVARQARDVTEMHVPNGPTFGIGTFADSRRQHGRSH
jgi:hypothetical protein